MYHAVTSFPVIPWTELPSSLCLLCKMKSCKSGKKEFMFYRKHCGSSCFVFCFLNQKHELPQCTHPDPLYFRNHLISECQNKVGGRNKNVIYCSNLCYIFTILTYLVSVCRVLCACAHAVFFPHLFLACCFSLVQ